MAMGKADIVKLNMSLEDCGRHPLLLTVVVGSIFEYLNLADLKHCRIVRKLWNEIAISKLRKIQDCIRLFTDERLQSFVGYALKSFSCNFPFMKFQLNLLDIYSDKLILKFLRIIAFHVTELEIEFYINNNEYSFKSQILHKLDFPALKKLRLSVVCFEERIKQFRKKQDTILDLVRKIFEKSPKLEGLDFYDGDTSVCESLNSFLEVLRIKNYSRLRNLHISTFNLKNEHFEKLEKELRLKLSSFSFLIFDCEHPLNPDILKAFLETQSDTLETLILGGNVQTTGNRILFPKMKKLTSFTFNGDGSAEHTNPAITFHNLDHKAQLPVLKSVSFSFFVQDEWVEFISQPGVTAVDSIEELKLPSFINNEENIRRILTTFPNVRKLSIPARFEFLRIVYNSLPNLEELELDTLRTSCIDNVITGFNEDECVKLAEFSQDVLNRLWLDFEELDEAGLKISMGCLKNLKRLSFNASYEWETAEITKVSTILVLSRMKGLAMVDFGNRTEEALETLHDVIEVLQTKFNEENL